MNNALLKADRVECIETVHPREECTEIEHLFTQWYGANLRTPAGVDPEAWSEALQTFAVKFLEGARPASEEQFQSWADATVRGEVRHFNRKRKTPDVEQYRLHAAQRGTEEFRDQVEELRRTLRYFSKEDQRLLTHLYWSNPRKTGDEVAHLEGVSRRTVYYRQEELLARLRVALRVPVRPRAAIYRTATPRYRRVGDWWGSQQAEGAQRFKRWREEQNNIAQTPKSSPLYM